MLCVSKLCGVLVSEKHYEGMDELCVICVYGMYTYMRTWMRICYLESAHSDC